MKIEEKFDFNDILIQPNDGGRFSSRSEINCMVDDFTLPLFTAPMDTVVSHLNYSQFHNNNINVCLPRGERMDIFKTSLRLFKSYGLSEFISVFLGDEPLIGVLNFNHPIYILIDIANGHMIRLEHAISKAKEIYGDHMIIMAGNVANPNTYERLSDAGADYIRVGIGNGGGCLTTQNTGVGYPMGSLIRECYHKKLIIDNPAYIIADGGMKTYSDVIKAIALGADYVMLGSILNKALESCGENYIFKHIKVNDYLAEKLYSLGLPIYKKFRGMSTKEVQKKWGKTTLKTSEGVIRYRKVEYHLEQWVENFDHYLRSAMSYSNAKDLEEFRDKVVFNKITNNAYKRFNK